MAKFASKSKTQSAGIEDSRTFRRTDPAWKLVHCYVLENLGAMISAEPIAREGLDSEGVHQMRVATRRLRAVFRAFKRLLPGLTAGTVSEELKWLSACLGAVRDLDVYLASLSVYVSEITRDDRLLLADYEEHLSATRRSARDNLMTCLSSQRYAELKLDLQDLLESKFAESLAPKVRQLSIRQAAEALINKQYKRVLRDGRAIEKESRNEALHQLRIECKRLRYLFEIFQPAFGKPLTKCVRRLKKLQDLLGAFQDACVALRDLRSYAGQLPMQNESRGQLLALGQLIHCVDQHASERRARFSIAWEKFDRPGRLQKLAAEFD